MGLDIENGIVRATNSEKINYTNENTTMTEINVDSMFVMIECVMEAVITVLLALLLAARAADSFVYSCEEVQYKILNKNFELDTDIICCVICDINYLDEIYAQSGDISHSLLNISATDGNCIAREGTDPWHIVSYGAPLDCSHEFTLIATSTISGIANTELINTSSQMELVAPSAVMSLVLNAPSCTGWGTISFDVGIGQGKAEQRYPLQTYSCVKMPEVMFFFNTAITVTPLDCECLFHFGGFIMTSVAVGATAFSRLAFMSSGKSGDLQNMAKYKPLEMFFGTFLQVSVNITGEYDIVADPRYQGNYTFMNMDGTAHTYYNGTGTVNFITNGFEFFYNTLDLPGSEVGVSIDNFVCNIYVNAMRQTLSTKPTFLPPPTTTASAAQTTTSSSKTTDMYKTIPTTSGVRSVLLQTFVYMSIYICIKNL
ncbi:hypothetical protein PENTCL1PPCAC_28140 [Pristionchus entomophagus]|uniref:CUB domain-containing protein n=1 Tax=Pristionchus entomophagus TaxID=358040 RepID=A0AAV5UG16_9BILA|nr:hypothetical protein PENTCL1PPCAC_28140 [Pristionchus entomophagus]